MNFPAYGAEHPAPASFGCANLPTISILIGGQRTLSAERTNMSIPVWAVLAFATWTIAILMLGVGVYRWSLILAGKAELKSFPGDEPHGSPLYRRAVRAHANCVENLPVFAAIVLAEQAAGAHSSTLDILSAGGGAAPRPTYCRRELSPPGSCRRARI